MKNLVLLLLGGLLFLLPVLIMAPGAMHYTSTYDFGVIKFNASVRQVLFVELVLIFLGGGIAGLFSRYKFVRRDRDEE